MAEPQDVIMPVLQKMQKDMSDFRKSVEAKINDLAESLLDVKTDVSTLNRYMSHHMGVTMQHHADFIDLRDVVADLQTRLKALEART